MGSEELANLAGEACDDKKAGNIQLIRVDGVSTLTDWIVVTEGLSDVQVRAIVKSVEDTLKDKANRIPLRKEGINAAKWALLDYGELIVHVFQPNERNFYDIEAFWSNGETHTFKTSSKAM